LLQAFVKPTAGGGDVLHLLFHRIRCVCEFAGTPSALFADGAVVLAPCFLQQFAFYGRCPITLPAVENFERHAAANGQIKLQTAVFARGFVNRSHGMIPF